MQVVIDTPINAPRESAIFGQFVQRFKSWQHQHPEFDMYEVDWNELGIWCQICREHKSLSIKRRAFCNSASKETQKKTFHDHINATTHKLAKKRSEAEQSVPPMNLSLQN